MALAPLDETISIQQLTDDPYPIYQRLRAETPVLRVKSVGRTLLTKAEDTKAVKDAPELFSSDDPNTPMERAFGIKTLMRRDGADHLSLREAMAPAFTAKAINGVWMPIYDKIADEYLDRLPKGEVVDLHKMISSTYAARGLAHLMGIEDASDAQMEFWSQALIDGAGNFGWQPEPFRIVDRANMEMDEYISRNALRYADAPNASALSVMVNADEPIQWSQIVANIKIAIGGGLNEPRDALSTILYGLLTNPEVKERVMAEGAWMKAFEEGVRWVAPIQASSRRVLEDTQIRGHDIPKGDVVMTIQASANRDEEVYDKGDAYDPFRETSAHQAFGNGPHFCMGTHIARRTLSMIMLPKLFERFPNMELADASDVVWSGFGFRGPLNLPVRLNA